MWKDKIKPFFDLPRQNTSLENVAKKLGPIQIQLEFKAHNCSPAW